MRLNNRLQKTGAIALILSAILFILLSSVKDIGSEEYIWIEAENADYVTAPLYIERDEDASGGKIVVCKGVHASNSGVAQYKISVKKEGKYYFWGKCYWKDACSNWFRIQYNNTRYYYGDDPVYGKWHWVKGPAMPFKQGINEVFLLSNDEDAKMDEILLTMDPEYVPFDRLREVYFLDFEDSPVNKLQIKNPDGWRIINDSTSSACVLVSPKGNREIALLDKTDCKDDFIFQVTAKATERQTKLLIIIDYVNEKNYRFISIDRTNVRYCRFNSDHDDLIFEKKGDFLNNAFKSIALAKTGEYLKLKIEGKTVFNLTSGTEMKGKTGIGVSEGSILLDNIAYYFPASPVQEESFHDLVDYQFHKDRPEKAIKPFENMKAGHNDWWAMSGNWKRTREYTEDIRGFADDGIKKPAILIFGNDFWKDYTFNVAAKVEDDSGFGICTCFQDSLNYYLFRWFHDGDGYKRQLIKTEDGNEKVLASDNETFVTGAWYDLGLKIYGDKLTATVNNESVLTATDHTFKEGRPGFWTNSSRNAHFDDVKINVSDSIPEIKNYRNYTFYTGNGGSFARSLCDWTPDSQKNLYLHAHNGTQSGYILKKVLEDVIFNNINALPGTFKMEVNTSRVPQDIDAVFEFASRGETTNVYKFIISGDEIILLKNGNVLSSNALEYDRKKIAIYRLNNEWTVECDAKKAFEYKDKTETGPWNMTLSYSGIGKGQLFLYRITVENHL
ncbi:MAG: hypothetical protein LBG96_05050 [Tannerella sp.]|jgi:hypothetical protein|nr:hypothetical protein [Tannerella sp.]